MFVIFDALRLWQDQRNGARVTKPARQVKPRGYDTGQNGEQHDPASNANSVDRIERYWPAFYLIDKQGVVRKVFVGETHVGDSQARQIQQAVSELLAEK